MHHLAAVEAVADLAEDAQPAPGSRARFQRPLLAAVEAQETQIEDAALSRSHR
jgi:hypothetical protein